MVVSAYSHLALWPEDSMSATAILLTLGNHMQTPAVRILQNNASQLQLGSNLMIDGKGASDRGDI